VLWAGVQVRALLILPPCFVACCFDPLAMVMCAGRFASGAAAGGVGG
jgi:hypothetical protein